MTRRGREPAEFSKETEVLKAFISDPQAAPAANSSFPKVSIVIPSFNQARFIERTLLSVLNQQYPNIEIIVIDGGSSDGTVELLERYRGVLSYVHSGPDAGQSDALNHGFSRATGDVVGWLNSDDLLLPGALESAVTAFIRFPRATVVFGDWWSIDSSDNVTEINYAFDFSIGQFLYEGFHLNSQAMFWRMDAHRRFGKFNVNLHRTMDYDLILRLGLNEGSGRFLRVEQPLACFRRHPEQKTTNNGRDLVAHEHRVIAAEHGLMRKYSVLGRVLRLVYRARRAWWYLRRGGPGFTVQALNKSRAMKG